MYGVKGIQSYGSRPSRTRGLKPQHRRCTHPRRFVASLADAWIETRARTASTGRAEGASLADAWIETSNPQALCPSSAMSRPSRTRGLKHRRDGGEYVRRVASLADAWIETGLCPSPHALRTMSRPSRTRGLKQPLIDELYTCVESRPSRTRGLKLLIAGEFRDKPGRVPRGRVD